MQDKEFKPTPKKLKEFLYGRLCFRSQNYIAGTKDIKEKFNVVLCLSTAKWVHLNFGDTGIKTFFLKAYEQLDKEGLFFIEAQPWKSYKKKKHLAPHFKANFDSIKLKPHLFKEYLQ